MSDLTPAQELREAEREARKLAEQGAHGPFLAELHGAVAELLDKTAWMLEIDPDLIGRVSVDEVIKVARTYLRPYLGSHPQ